MEIIFYPYDFEYRVEKEKTFMYLYGKTTDHEKICVVHEHPAFFYAKKTTETFPYNGLTVPTKKEAAKITKIEEINLELLGQEQQFWKIYVNYPKAVPILSKHLVEDNIPCYEKDILYTHRYLRDNKITPLTKVKVTGEFLTQKPLPIFHATNVEDLGKDMPQEWNVLAVDIETYAKDKEINPEKNPILMIALYSNNFKKVLTWKDFPHDFDYVEVLKDEEAMLKRFSEIINEQDPEFITGYYSDKFDFPYIDTRAKKYDLSMILGVNNSNLFIRSGRGFHSNEAKVTGRVHLDVHTFIKQILGQNLKTDSFSLNAVAEELLGHKKHDVNLDDLSKNWDNHPEELASYCAYNLQDAKLTFDLCQHIFPILIEFTKLIALPPYDLSRMRYGKLVENYILKQSIKKNVIAPNKATGQELERRMEEHIQGAFVFQPTPNIYEEIVVFDFSSLYPTIITAHNIGPEGFQCDCCKDKQHVPEREQYWFCQEKKSFLPSVLEHIILRRTGVKRLIKGQKEKDEPTGMLDARSFALKILANSFYGYLGFFGARWYCFGCAASTTAYARDYIKQTIHKAEQKGFKVIYADTDSCFLILGKQKLDDALAFMNEVNFDLPGHMELEFEGYFPKGIFVATKGTKKGAKKKYALLQKNGKLKITGFEFVRRNWSPLAKEVQQHVLQEVLKGNEKEALIYVRDVAKKLKEGKIPLKQLILKTQLTRPVDKYTSVGPHVSVAKQLIAQGKKVGPGSIIEYVIAKGSGLVRERAKIPDEVENYDINYYLKQQLLPVVSSIFAVLGYSEDDIISESSQQGLGKFF
ncbi:hypothetical protein HOC32_02825 [Candidatus Woesearchaeota archaeon]|nr:hypothetical protein [Candidatus Woesearchaeota archaeon]